MIRYLIPTARTRAVRPSEEIPLHRYREVRLSNATDPLSVVAQLTDSDLLGTHVVYERDRCWHVAAAPLGEVVVDTADVLDTFGGTESASPWSGTPWPQVREALERVPVDGWNAYGWAAFELASGATEHGTLAHLFVPRLEFRVTEREVLIRATDRGLLDAAKLVVQQTTEVGPQPQPTPVDVRATDDPTYREGVAHAVSEIRSGRLQKVVLSRTIDLPFRVDMTATYLRGRGHNTPARSFLLDLSGWQAAGFSPETVVEVDPSGLASTQPLAGTRARQGDEETDQALREELTTDPKEVFEHATSVKLAVDELSAVGDQGATRVSEFLTVKQRGTVQHLASRVDTDLGGRPCWDALAALFPAVTASGIPKAPAYELIREAEPHPRGLYAGAVLMASSDGGLDAALVLRAIYQRDGNAWLRAGAGVVADSNPEREHEETCEKLSSIAPHLVPDRTADAELDEQPPTLRAG